MLAQLGRNPFDSDDHFFEWKWDGFRALVRRDESGATVRSRRDNDLRPRFPELSILDSLPEGVLLDGEIVALQDGKPSFQLLLKRERTKAAGQIDRMSKSSPVLFVAFDCLYHDGEAVMDETLMDRRERLRSIIEPIGHARILLSDGIVGRGTKLFEESKKQDLEGIVAKRMDSVYLPGRRSDAWTKIKKSTTVYCVIMGFQVDETGGLRSLVVATDEGGSLRCVGRVGSGLNEVVRRTLLPELESRVRPEPFVATSLEETTWVDPGLFCIVSYVEMTEAGQMRAPVFVEWVQDG